MLGFGLPRMGFTPDKLQIKDPAVEVITLSTAQQSDGVYNLTEINGIRITNFDTVSGLLNSITLQAGTFGQIAVQVSPDGGTTIRTPSMARINNNTASANWNRYVRTSAISLQAGGTHDKTAFVIRNLNNPEVPTTIDFFNNTTEEYLGGGVYDDGTLGSYAEERHNLIRFTGFSAAFAVSRFTGGLLELTGWRGHARTTQVFEYTHGDGVSDLTIDIPNGHTMGQLIFAVDLSASSYLYSTFGRNGTPYNGATDNSFGTGNKGNTSVLRQANARNLSGHDGTNPRSRANTHDGFLNLWNLNVAAPAYWHGVCFSPTDNQCAIINNLCRGNDENAVNQISIGANSTPTMQGKIWLVTFKRRANVEKITFAGTENFEYTSIYNGNKDPNNCICFVSENFGTTANTVPGLQCRQGAGNWLTGSNYPNTAFYSAGDGSAYHTFTCLQFGSGTDHGFATSIWNATWHDKDGTRGARPSFFGQSLHKNSSDVTVGARFASGIIASPTTGTPIDEYRWGHANAASTKLTGTAWAVDYEMGG